jgi:hypothetical protein
VVVVPGDGVERDGEQARGGVDRLERLVEVDRPVDPVFSSLLFGHIPEFEQCEYALW